MNAANRNESTPGLPRGSGVSVSDTEASGASDTEVSGASADPPRSKAKAAGRMLGALVPFGLLALIVWVDFPLCPFRVISGVDCPGCGLTRATWAMLQLHFGEMLRMHPLAPILAPLVVITLVRGAAQGLGHPLPKLPFRVPQGVWLGLVALLLGLWALRLAGYLGGTPDPIDFSHGLVGRAWRLLF